MKTKNNCKTYIRGCLKISQLLKKYFFLLRIIHFILQDHENLRGQGYPQCKQKKDCQACIFFLPNELIFPFHMVHNSTVYIHYLSFKKELTMVSKIFHILFWDTLIYRRLLGEKVKL